MSRRIARRLSGGLIVLAVFSCAALGILAAMGPRVADDSRPPPPAKAVRVRGEVVDAETGEPIPARVYVRRGDGDWFFPKPVAPGGTAVEYRRQRKTPRQSVEMHTTLSAHPFA